MDTNWLEKAENTLRIGTPVIAMASGSALLGTGIAGPAGAVAGALVGALAGALSGVYLPSGEAPKKKASEK